MTSPTSPSAWQPTIEIDNVDLMFVDGKGTFGPPNVQVCMEGLLKGASGPALLVHGQGDLFDLTKIIRRVINQVS